MTKVELEVKIEALQKLLGEKVTEQTTYQNQINELQRKLDDLNKPKLTPIQFDEVNEAIQPAIGNFEFDNEDNYSIDLASIMTAEYTVSRFSLIMLMTYIEKYTKQ